MAQYKVRVHQDSSEDVEYDELGIPIWLHVRNLSDYEGMRSWPHWHEEIEIMYIVNGVLDYHVNGRTLRLHANDCTIINSYQINYSTSVDMQECTFACFLIHPSLLAANRKIYDRCIAPAIHNPDFEYYRYDRGTPFHEEISSFMKNLISEKADRQPGYELRLIHEATGFWLDFVDHYQLLERTEMQEGDPSFPIYRNMLSYVHQHYMDKIGLQNIADAGNVCRSKCCQLFRKYLNMTPVDFLNQYRLEIGCKMLSDPALSVTDISGFCGFGQPSYFTASFRKKYGMAPVEYRKKEMRN